MMRLAFVLLLGFLSNACQTVESISVSQIPAEKARETEIQAESSSPIIFFIPFGSGYIDTAREDLLSQCASPSKIEGTLSKHSSTNYLFGLFMSQKVAMKAYCVAAQDPSVKMKAKSRGKSSDEMDESGGDEKPEGKRKKSKSKSKKAKKGE